MNSGEPRAVSATRVWSGLGVGAGGLTMLTAVLGPGRPHVSLASVALVYLVPVVAAAALGGVWPAMLTALGAELLVNFFFVPPYRTLVVQSGDHVVVLVVYVLVAAALSVAVEVAARRRAQAARREIEASLLAEASAEPVAEQSLPRLLDQVRATFRMSAVALLESGPAGERQIEQVGEAPSGRPVLSAAAGPGLRLVAWGPEPFAEDRRALQRLASAAARTLEARRLAEEAGRAQQLAEVDRVRTALLSAVGHDLRTPLAGIKAAVSGLRQPGIQLPPAASAELLATIEESTNHLDALVENLLAMSRLQAGVLSVHCEAVALDGVVAGALLHRSRGDGDAADITLDIPDDLPLVRADPGLLERVVANLVSNAVTATIGGDDGAGAVLLRGRSTSSGVQLQVVDHGPGVPDDDLERIFAPFQRLDDRSARAGLGLGLAIARGFTEAMGGTLVPTPTMGGGLTMTIRLPTEPSGEERP